MVAGCLNLQVISFRIEVLCGNVDIYLLLFLSVKVFHEFLCSHCLQEPLGGAHADPLWSSQQIKFAIIQAVVVKCFYSRHYKLEAVMIKER